MHKACNFCIFRAHQQNAVTESVIRARRDGQCFSFLFGGRKFCCTERTLAGPENLDIPSECTRTQCAVLCSAVKCSVRVSFANKSKSKIVCECDSRLVNMAAICRSPCLVASCQLPFVPAETETEAPQNDFICAEQLLICNSTRLIAVWPSHSFPLLCRYLSSIVCIDTDRLSTDNLTVPPRQLWLCNL